MTKKSYTVPVNGELLRISRLEIGLSLREFSKLSQSSIPTINSIEKRNAVNRTTPIQVLQNIVAACGITLTEFFTPKDQQQVQIHDPDIHIIARRLAAILARDNRLHDKTMLLEHFNITFATLNQATALLNDLAAPLGLRVHQNPSAIGLRPIDPEAQDHFKKIDRRRVNIDGYQVTDMTFVYQALRGTIAETPTHAQRPRLGRLIRLGVLRPGKFEEPLHVLTEQAVFAFDIPGIDIDVEHAPSLTNRPLNSETRGSKRTKPRNAARTMSTRHTKKRSTR